MVKCTCGVEYDESNLEEFAEHVHDEGRPTEPAGPPEPEIAARLWIGQTRPSLELLAEGLRSLQPNDPNYWQEMTFLHMALAPSLGGQTP